MKTLISEKLEQTKLILIGSLKSSIEKYSLKQRDYTSDRFKSVSVDLTGFNDILNFTKPQIIGEIHERFLKSGVDIVSTNTNQSNRFFLEKYQLNDISYELNLAAAKIARDKVSKYTSITRTKPRYVAGTIACLPENISAKTQQNYFSEQFKALFAAKVDLILFDKFSNTVSLNAALSSLNEILVKREKTGEVILVIDNVSMKNWLFDKSLMNQYQAIEVAAAGFYEFDESSYKELREKSPYKTIGYLKTSEQEEDNYVVYKSKSVLDKNLIDIVAFDFVYQTLSLEEILEVINK